MKTSALNVELKRNLVRGGDETGTIAITAATEPTTPCLMAFGPHRGAVTFVRGRALPQLPNGQFKLVINGELYGTLTVAADAVILVEQTVGVEAGTFKLYNEPSHQANPGCDVHTQLDLISGFAGPLARLVNKLSAQSLCEIYVTPNERTFNLTERESIGCGSKEYRGTNGDASIKIIDHRGRICRDRLIAKVIVEETTAEGTIIRYSNP